MLNVEHAFQQTPNALFANVFSFQPFVLAPPHPDCRVSIAIPVRDEEQSLPRALAALARQVDFNHQPLNPHSYEIIILANNCQDQTAAAARRLSHQTGALPVHVAEISLPAREAHVGRARRTAMDLAFERLSSLGRRRGVIATTDGDTCVAPNWVAATMHEIERGADAVSGRILVDPCELATLSPCARRYHLYDVCYRLLAAELETLLDPTPEDPHPRHHQHFGASLAITIESYARVGGVPAVRHLEDAALYAALKRIDAAFRHSPLVRVTTSARRSGRTTLGLSTQLEEWALMKKTNETYFVESAGELETWFQVRHKLRRLWRETGLDLRSQFDDDLAAIAKVLMIDANQLKDFFSQAPTLGVLLEETHNAVKNAAAWRARFPLVDVKRAISDLRVRLQSLRAKSNQKKIKLM